MKEQEVKASHKVAQYRQGCQKKEKKLSAGQEYIHNKQAAALNAELLDIQKALQLDRIMQVGAPVIDERHYVMVPTEF